MSEVKNEGLEVVATFDGLYLVPLAIMDAGTDLCLHSEALAGYAVRDARIAELEGKNARLTAGVDSDMADIDRMQLLYDAEFRKCRQLRAELAALNAKLDASKFCANVADDLRAELAAIKVQSGEALAKIAKHAPAVNCPATTQLERVGLIAVHALIAFSAPNFSSPRAEASQTTDVVGTSCAAPVAKPKAQGCTKPGCFPYCDCGGIDDAPVSKQVVMPERYEYHQIAFEIGGTDGGEYHFDPEDLDAFVARLNAADQEGDQDE